MKQTRTGYLQQFHYSVCSFYACIFGGSHLEMAKPLPVVAQEDLDSFTLTRTGSGFALKAFHVSWNTQISVRLLTSQNATERERKQLLQDIAIVRCCKSERLLPALGIYQYHGLVGIVTEWMSNGSLHSLIHEHQLYPDLPFPLLIRILSDVAEGLHHLHSLEPAFCHCSLKPSNVLLDMQYRAKISDYGLTNWRKQQLRSDLQNCNQRKCQDLVYIPPEILRGGLPSQEGDIYRCGLYMQSCGITGILPSSLEKEKKYLDLQQNLLKKTDMQGMRITFLGNDDTNRTVFLDVPLPSITVRAKDQNPSADPLCLQEDDFSAGQTTLLEVLTGIGNGLRPGISEEFIPSNLPQRNTLLHFITLCWHQEPDYRPHTAECIALLNGILTTINKEAISNAIYNLMDAKETALNACKGSEIYTLQTGIRNSEVICPQKNNKVMSKKIPLVLPSLSTILLDSNTNHAGRENIEMDPANSTPQNATKKAHPGSDCRKSFCTPPLSGPMAGKENSQHKDPPLALKHKQQTTHPEQAVTGPCCKGNCCQILTCQRGTILSCMTEGRLNHILDVLRSQQMLSRMDYETITSCPTVTGRARALLDICLSLGERAAQAVVTVLTETKCSPLGRGHCTDCPAEKNRLLL